MAGIPQHKRDVPDYFPDTPSHMREEPRWCVAYDGLPIIALTPSTLELAELYDGSTYGTYDEATGALMLGSVKDGKRLRFLVYAGDGGFEPYHTHGARWKREQERREAEEAKTRREAEATAASRESDPAPVEVGAVRDPSTPLAIVAGGLDRAEWLAEDGIAALVYDAIYGDPPVRFSFGKHIDTAPTAPTAPLWRNEDGGYLNPELYAYELYGRRVVIVAPPYTGPRAGNPSDRLASFLREEGVRVTVAPGSGNAVEAIRGALNNYGAFRRTTGGGGEPEPLIDGVLYKRQNHTVYGDAGNGKTLLACYASSLLVKRGENVAFLDRENGAGRVLERMRALGCSEEQLGRHLYYFEDPPGTLDQAPDYREMLADVKPSLVVFDSLFGFLGAADLDENYGRDVAAWFDSYAPPTLDTATLILDHPPKSGGTARGSSRKLDAVDVSYELSGRFSPQNVGTITLKLKKARDGGLPDKVVFTVGGTPLRFERGGSRKLRPEEHTLDALQDGFTAGQWLDASGQPESTFFRHRGKLLDAGLVAEHDGAYSHTPKAQ